MLGLHLCQLFTVGSWPWM